MKTLKDLTSEELKKLYEENEWLRQEVNNSAAESMYFCQGEDAELMGAAKVFEYHDHYSSFYYTTPKSYGVKNGYAVAHKLDRDYLNEENAKLYDQLNELADRYDQAEEYSDEAEAIEDQLDEISDKLAAGITDQLREHEDAYTDYIQSELDMIGSGDRYWSDLELTEDGKIKEVLYH